MQLDVPLGQDERVLQEYEFGYSIILFFLKSHFWLTNKRLIVNVPNVFMVIPTGKETVTYPLKNIAAVRTKTEFKFVSLLLGVVFLSVSSNTGSWLLGILLALFGVSLTIGAFQTLIMVVSSGGDAQEYSHPFWEAANVKKMINALNQIVAET